MDVKALAQVGVDTFNDRSFREKAKDLMDPNVVIIDTPTGQELHGPDDYVQFSEGFVNAIPDLKGTAIEHKVNGNTVTSRVRGQGNFTGTLQTPQGNFPGNGNPVDIEYQIEQEFNDEGRSCALLRTTTCRILCTSSACNSCDSNTNPAYVMHVQDFVILID
jgi:hypothetical protein